MNKAFMSLPIIFFAMLADSPADDLLKLKEELKEETRKSEQHEKRIEELEAAVSGMSDWRSSLSSKFSFNLGVFGDVNYSTETRMSENATFSVGEFDLYGVANYGNIAFLMELVMEFEEDGSTEAEMERLWISYAASDALTMRGGRFHTLGYWNTTYHHGKHFFPTVDRPFFLSFEHDGGVMPTHIVGLEFAGRFKPTDKLKVNYSLQAGNGPAMEDNRLAVSNEDENNSKQAVFRISIGRDSLPAVGLFFTRFKLDTALKEGLKQTIYGADIFYEIHPVEFLAEYYRFSNAARNAFAYYTQASYNLDGLTPYVRFEKLNIRGDDPYLSDLNAASRRQFIAGLRYDIDYAHSSLKAQYRRDFAEDDEYDVFEAQWTFHF